MTATRKGGAQSDKSNQLDLEGVGLGRAKEMDAPVEGAALPARCPTDQVVAPSAPSPGRLVVAELAPAVVGRQVEPTSLRRYRRTGGRNTEIETVGELLCWSYANLAAASAAEQRGLRDYDGLCWMIRARLFKGLRNGTMKLGTLHADAVELPNDRCVYCGATPPPKLHGDHLIPKHRGGPESADNLVWACRSCNSSKNARDLLEWYAAREELPTLLLMRRYLKLAIAEARSRQIMDAKLVDRPATTFSLDHVPTYYPLQGEPDETGGPVERL